MIGAGLIFMWSIVASVNQALGLIKRTYYSRSLTVITKLLKGLINLELEFDVGVATLVNKGNSLG